MVSAFCLDTGHTGTVLASSFSPNGKFLLSASEDATCVLWNLEARRNLVAYRSHTHPIWDVSFAPLGFYFATASQYVSMIVAINFFLFVCSFYSVASCSDRTARLWSTDKAYALRVFVGHKASVEVTEQIFFAIDFNSQNNRLVCLRLFASIQVASILRLGLVISLFEYGMLKQVLTESIFRASRIQKHYDFFWLFFKVNV